MAPRFQAALFDIDGTLLDSTEFILGAMEHAFRAHGMAPPTRQVLAQTMGPSLQECYRILAPQADLAALCTAHRAWQRERMDLVRPYPHAAATLARLREAGVKLAAVTARSRTSSLGTLDGAGLGAFITVTISAEDAPRVKPHPDPLHLALERLGVRPAEAVMVGDTLVDIAAGKAAGVMTVAALYGFGGQALASAGADYLIRDIAEVVPIILGK